MTAAAHEVGTLPGPPMASTGPVRPDRLTVWPMEEGFFGIDVRWHGRDCTLRATVVRLTLIEAGFEAQLGHSLDGREWELRTGPVPAGEIGHVIDNFIW
jgi:hypothetical protein